MTRPPIEHYARCSVAFAGVVVEPGLELRRGDDLDVLTAQIECLAGGIGLGSQLEPDRARYLESLAVLFEELWPGRAWFVEIHDAKLSRWTQSYQPYGIPRAEPSESTGCSCESERHTDPAMHAGWCPAGKREKR